MPKSSRHTLWPRAQLAEERVGRVEVPQRHRLGDLEHQAAGDDRVAFGHGEELFAEVGLIDRPARDVDRDRAVAAVGQALGEEVDDPLRHGQVELRDQADLLGEMYEILGRDGGLRVLGEPQQRLVVGDASRAQVDDRWKPTTKPLAATMPRTTCMRRAVSCTSPSRSSWRPRIVISPPAPWAKRWMA